ncbi:MAG: glycyl-radical enzyme activating protein [Clostridiaceae bacterium]
MKKAIIFNIQRYSLHDGGGIRTVVFFKGCPLRCPWCSNPESQSFTPEILKKESLCIKCSSDSVFNCTVNPDDCPTGALEVAGRDYTVEEVLKEVKKDIVFYDTTGGGVTLSGGEPLSQGSFIVELLKELKNLGINTAIETTGIGKWELIDQAADWVDTFLWDFKIMNRDKAKEIVKQDIDLMKTNFEKLIKKHSYVNVIPRLPLIPGYTSSMKNIREIIDFTARFGIKEVNILPFHQFGSSKYKALGRDYKLKDLSVLKKEEIEEIKKYIESRGITVVVGGD